MGGLGRSGGGRRTGGGSKGRGDMGRGGARGGLLFSGISIRNLRALGDSSAKGGFTSGDLMYDHQMLYSFFLEECRTCRMGGGMRAKTIRAGGRDRAGVVGR